MPVAFLLLLIAVVLTQPPATAALRAQAPGAPAAGSSLDFEFFRTKVQPILLATRERHTRCFMCHSHGTPMRLQELSPGATTWNEEQSRRNFQVVTPRMVPLSPLQANCSSTRLCPRQAATSITAAANTGTLFSIRSGRRSPTGYAGGKSTRKSSS